MHAARRSDVLHLLYWSGLFYVLSHPDAGLHCGSASCGPPLTLCHLLCHGTAMHCPHSCLTLAMVKETASGPLPQPRRTAVQLLPRVGLSRHQADLYKVTLY